MKKKIGFAGLDPTLIQKLNEYLCSTDLCTENQIEFVNNLQALVERKIHGLLLELDDNSQTQLMSEPILRCGNLTIQPRSRQVSIDNKEVSLTPKEFDILYFLARHRGEVFTKEQIYQAVWESDYLLDDSNIMAFIRKLRKKIEPQPDDPQYILTIWGIGYKFNDQIE